MVDEMSTRACYTFADDNDSHHVYKHHDGYPTGAADAIAEALILAWKLPRFEPDEFGAAFIAANKNISGGLRLTHGPDSHGDIEYKYRVYMARGQLQVDCDEREGWEPTTWKQIYSGNFDEFAQWAIKYESEAA